jgi:hypothetical protein
MAQGICYFFVYALLYIVIQQDTILVQAELSARSVLALWLHSFLVYFMLKPFCMQLSY